MAGTANEYAKLPLPLRELYEKALEFSRSNGKSISDRFAELPFSQQKILEQTLLKIDPSSQNQSPWGPLGMSVVVALESHVHHPKKSALRRFKTFFGLENSEIRGRCVRITLMRFLNTKAQEDELAKKRVAEQIAEAAEAEAAAFREEVQAAAAAAVAPALATPTERKEPVKFRDAVGRNFSFPFESCCTWEVCFTPYSTTVDIVETIRG